jgi:hypothetical protein
LVWKDEAFSASNDPFKWDMEHKGIEIYNSMRLNNEWGKYWPTSGNVQNWDAVAEISVNDSIEYIFVEAKAHINEIQSTCGASIKSKAQIEIAMQETIDYYNLKNAIVSNWFTPYYQYANRLAFLHFLMKNNIKAHLLFIYFYGNEQKNTSSICPNDKLGWDKELNKMFSQLGIDKNNLGLSFDNRVHKLFLSTNPNVRS